MVIKQLQSLHNAVIQRLRVQSFGSETWNSMNGKLGEAEETSLKARKSLYLLYRSILGLVFLPMYVARVFWGLLQFSYDLERVHFRGLRKMNHGRGCLIDKQTHIINGQNITLGDFVKVSCFTSIIAGEQSIVSVGSNTIIASGVMICATNHGTDPGDVPMRYQKSVESDIFIGADVWIGANAVILPGARICDGVVVAAGSIVNAEIKENSIFYRQLGSVKSVPRVKK